MSPDLMIAPFLVLFAKCGKGIRRAWKGTGLQWSEGWHPIARADLELSVYRSAGDFRRTGEQDLANGGWRGF